MEIKEKKGKTSLGENWPWPRLEHSHEEEGKWTDGRHVQEVQSTEPRGWPNGERWEAVLCGGLQPLHLPERSWGRQAQGCQAFSCHFHPPPFNYSLHHFAIGDSYFSNNRKAEMEETGDTFHKWQMVGNDRGCAFFFLSKDKDEREQCTSFRCAFKPSCVAFSSALTVKLSGSSLSRIWDSFNRDSSFFLMKDSTWCSVVPLFCKELSNGNDFP